MKDNIRSFLKTNQGKVVGGAFGLLIAILIMTINIWRTLLLFLLIGLGVYLGSRIDRGKNFGEILDRLFQSRTK